AEVSHAQGRNGEVGLLRAFEHANPMPHPSNHYAVLMKFAFAPSRIHMRSDAHWRYLPCSTAARPQARERWTIVLSNEERMHSPFGRKRNSDGSDAKIIVTQIARAVRKRAALIVRHVRRLIEARRRRVACEQEFYRAYEASCRV